MPHYHFDVFDGRAVVDDAFGDTFADAAEAMDQAAGLLMDVARDGIARDEVGDFGVVVRDDRGVDLYWAALMFRASRIDPARSRHLRSASPAAGEAAELVRRSRQLRAAVDETWQEFLATLADVSQTIAETRGLASPAGGEGVR